MQENKFVLFHVCGIGCSGNRKQAPHLENTSINQFSATKECVLKMAYLNTSPSGKANNWSHVRPDREAPNMNTLQEHLSHHPNYSKVKSGNL